MTKILSFDTETTGFIKENLDPMDQNQPWPVQIAAIMANENGVVQSSINFLINPPIPIEQGAFQTHGITQERVQKFGFKPITAITVLYALIIKSDIIVGHNLGFDIDIIKLAKARLGIEHTHDLFDGKEHFCTQARSTGICNLPPTENMIKSGFHDKFKSPKLSEAYRFFFDEEISGAHDALADAMAALRIYFHIKKLETEAKNA